jgi:hypothetical protein
MSKKINIFGSYSSDGLVFDKFGIGIAGFSVQRLSSSYLGACLRVQRSSDNSEQDIGFVDDELDTVSLLSFVGTGTGYVTIWYNQGSGVINAVQTVQSFMPTIVESGVVNLSSNGKPTLKFLLDKMIVLNQFGLTDTRSNFSVWETTGSYAGAYHNIYIYLSETLSATNFQHVYGAVNLAINSNYPASALDHTNKFVYADNTSQIVTQIKTALGAEFSKNDLTTPNTSSSANVNNTLSLGNFSSNYFNGNMNEMIVYTEDKSSDKTNIVTNRNDYYNIF